MEKAFRKDGQQGVEDIIDAGVKAQRQLIPPDFGLPQLLQLARQHMQNGRYIAAKDIYSSIRDVQPDNFDAVCGMGAAALAMKLPDLAIAALSYALKLQPQSPVANAMLGDVLRSVSRFSEAEALFRTAHATAKNDPFILSSLALTLNSLGRPQDGLEYAAAAVKAGAKFPLAHHALGVNLASFNRNAEALAAFKAAVAADPSFAPAREAMEKLASVAEPQK
jgi:tetratricopeptide (TPR) repeat protein